MKEKKTMKNLINNAPTSYEIDTYYIICNL